MNAHSINYFRPSSLIFVQVLSQIRKRWKYIVFNTPSPCKSVLGVGNVRTITGGPHNVCVCGCVCVCVCVCVTDCYLIVQCKCTGFTVCFTYNNISLSQGSKLTFLLRCQLATNGKNFVARS